MPVGKESIKRASAAGKKKAAPKAAPAVENSTVIAAPAEEVVQAVVTEPQEQPSNQSYGIGDALPFYLW